MNVLLLSGDEPEICFLSLKTRDLLIFLESSCEDSTKRSLKLPLVSWISREADESSLQKALTVYSAMPWHFRGYRSIQDSIFFQGFTL